MRKLRVALGYNFDSITLHYSIYNLETYPKRYKVCFGALSSTEPSQCNYFAHVTTLLRCRILRVTLGYNFDAITLNTSKIMTKKHIPNVKKRVLGRCFQRNYASMQR